MNKYNGFFKRPQSFTTSQEIFDLPITVFEELLRSTSSTFSLTLHALDDIVRQVCSSSPSHEMSAILFSLDCWREACIQLRVRTVYRSFEKQTLRRSVRNCACIRDELRNESTYHNKSLKEGPVPLQLRPHQARVETLVTINSDLSVMLQVSTYNTHYPVFPQLLCEVSSQPSVSDLTLHIVGHEIF
jgi:hypothetical protein